MKYWSLIVKRPLLFSTAWALFIFVLCATPGQYIPTANWLELLSFDKLVHAAIFFVLSAGLVLVALDRNLNSLYKSLLVALAIVYGASLEWMQANWFSHRSADVLDIAANSTGCAITWLLRFKIENWRSRAL